MGFIYQSSLLFNDMGVLHQRYDKIHLFRAMVADGVGSYDESRTFLAGNTPAVARCTLDGVSVGIGMTVCFDVRFPKLFGQLRSMGADIITVPSAFTHTTGQTHWQSLLTARALDSQCLVVGSAQGGMHHFTHKGKAQSRQTWGHAMMVNANGQIVASTNTADCCQFAIIYADFDKTAQDIIRQNMPIFDCAVNFT
ncbi:MAG: nitrilase-related carbon-nitrogen hydrolase [Moraxella sp.]|nr:nitrilase-related carbon-nitrogen hydrolase [Moraxella sp.]MDO4450289.1 nitrilase-related carbon-nitrogen hydrolase [Moraxella sp.]